MEHFKHMEILDKSPITFISVSSWGNNYQGRSHTFETGGAQAAKIILDPFNLKK